MTSGVENPIFTSEIVVDLKQVIGSDAMICDAARVSTLGAGVENRERDYLRDGNLIEYLMTSKHGSPFEHGSITFIVNAPIFVFWDHVRHRIGVSYNIESSRYRVLQPRFYVPEYARVQTGKPGAYLMSQGTEAQTEAVHGATEIANRSAWAMYTQLLKEGVAREQAMQVLPMNTMITGYVTFNPRSLMNFLELRLGPARKEMQILAEGYMRYFQQHWPDTHSCFVDNGMVAP